MFDRYYTPRFITTSTDAIGNTFDLWRFTSGKTGKEYMVIMEKYANDIYAIKFHLREHKKRKDRYSVMTGYGETSVIVWSVIQVLLIYANKYSKSSFVIMAAHSKHERNTISKRFRLYSNIIKRFVSSKQMIHIEYPDRNIYMLLRKSEVEEGNISDDCVLKFIYDYE